VRLTLSPQDLAKNPSIYLNGHLVSVLVFTRSAVNATLADKKLVPMLYHKKCNEIRIFSQTFGDYGVLKPDQTGLDDLSEKTEDDALAYARGKKKGPINGFVNLGSIHNLAGPSFEDLDTIPLKIATRNGVYEILIHQQKPVQIAIIGKTQFFYQGGAPEKGYRIRNEVLARIKGTLLEAESTSGFNVPKVNIRDLKNIQGSFLADKINLNIGTLDLAPETLEVLVRHEAIHGVVRKYQLITPDVENFFERLKGDPGKKAEADECNPVHFIQNDRGDTAYFTFLREGEFLLDGKSTLGHPWSNPAEMVTSFLNDLFRIERLRTHLGSDKAEARRRLGLMEELSRLLIGALSSQKSEGAGLLRNFLLARLSYLQTLMKMPEVSQD
jgi:hypothetical protein